MHGACEAGKLRAQHLLSAMQIINLTYGPQFVVSRPLGEVL